MCVRALRRGGVTLSCEEARLGIDMTLLHFFPVAERTDVAPSFRSSALREHCRAKAFGVLPRFHCPGSYANGMNLTFTIHRPRRRGCRIRKFPPNRSCS